MTETEIEIGMRKNLVVVVVVQGKEEMVEKFDVMIIINRSQLKRALQIVQNQKVGSLAPV